MNTKTKSDVHAEAFDTYYNGWHGKTPGNAARLAAEDHDAGPGALVEFSHHLRIAGRLCDEHADLRIALEKIAQQSAPADSMAAAMVAVARAALAKVES